ncbi:MAG TPA: hypothetical protein VIC08_10985 [Cellvibrionaceae bacterium]
MTMKHFGKTGRCVLWFSPVAIVPIAFIAAVPWLKQQSDTLVLGLTAVASIFVMGYSVFLAARVNRRLDEVEIAGQRFANTKGMTIGTIAAALVIICPPLINALVGLANTMSTGSPEAAIKIGITIGFMLVVLLQTLGTIAVAIWWGRRLGVPA